MVKKLASAEAWDISYYLHEASKPAGFVGCFGRLSITFHSVSDDPSNVSLPGNSSRHQQTPSLSTSCSDPPLGYRQDIIGSDLAIRQERKTARVVQENLSRVGGCRDVATVIIGRRQRSTTATRTEETIVVDNLHRH